MSSYKPIDIGKEDFRKYLDRTGVLDAMTKVLIKCNSDRPENAIGYLMDNLGDRLEQSEIVLSLKAELSNAQAEIQRLKQEISKLQGTEEADRKEEKAPSPDPGTASANSAVKQESPTTEKTEEPVAAAVPNTTAEKVEESEPKPAEVPANEVQTAPGSVKTEEKEKVTDETK